MRKGSILVEGFRLNKCYSLAEQQQAQAQDEEYCLMPNGASWVRQMSATWEILDYPGLAMSKEPPAHGTDAARWVFWMFENANGLEHGAAWTLCIRLKDQSFATRRDALQALRAAALKPIAALME